MYEVDFKIPCWYNCTTKNNIEIDCRKTCIRYKLMNFLIRNCGMQNAEDYLVPLKPENKDKLAFDDLNLIKNNILEFVNNGENLFISSTKFQNGKTTWSLKIMYKFFDEIWAETDFIPRGYFIYVPNFIQKNKSFEYKNTSEFKEIDKILMNADLVIWDDITANQLLPSEQSFLNNYISKRIQSHKANIFNGIRRDNLTEYLGEDISKRFDDFIQITLRGEQRKTSSYMNLKSIKK